MPSLEFETLHENIDDLKSVFLDFPKKTDGDYTNKEMMNCRAFITFSHAEFEQYLENLSIRILDNAIKKWQENNIVSVVALGILAFRRRKDTAISNDPDQPGKRNKLTTILMEAFNNQKDIIKGNHGISPKNFANLFTPLGITENEVDGALIIQLGNTSSHRGSLVHRTTNKSLQMIKDPFTVEEQEINYLVSELKNFDKRIRDLKFV